MLEKFKVWLAGDAADQLTGYRFEFNAPIPQFVAGGAVALAAILIAVYYWRRVAKSSLASRILLVSLRAALIALVIFLLLDPVVVADHVEPGQRTVVLLFDNSKSMQIQGEDNLSRGRRMTEAYQAARKEFEEKISKKYRLASYSFGDGIAPIKSPDALAFTERESDLTGAIQSSMAELQDVDVSAVILFSDGVKQSKSGLQPDPDLKSRLAKSVTPTTPIFTVGVDTEAPWRDLELSNLSVTRTKFDKSPVVVTAQARATGLAGDEGILEATRNGHVVKSVSFKLGEDGQDKEARLEFVPEDRDWLEYEVRARLAETGPAQQDPPVADISAGGKDRVVQNNSRRFAIDNRQKNRRILYLCGRPNWENKFIRRALEPDEELKLTSLIRISGPQKKFVFRGKKSATSANPLFEGFAGMNANDVRYDEAVFIRLGVTGSELDKGYPSHPTDLFSYDLVVWSEMEYNFFSQEQVELTRDFVRKRGGSWLFLGGPHAFTEGKYDGTLVEGMMPVVLRPSSSEDKVTQESLNRRFNVRPTVEGQLSGSLSLDANPIEDHKLWEQMPQLAGINLFPLVRPGATVLARAESESSEGGPVPLFLVQRYGEGKSACLATGSTWQWRLQLDASDNRHERLWRQTIRSLVDSVPEPVFLKNKADAYISGEEASFDVIVRDKLFDEREGLRTTFKITTPSGVEISPSVEESIHETGLYSAKLTPSEAGLHKISIDAVDEKGEAVGHLEDAFLAQPDDREFQNAQYRPEFLRELAEKSGGKFFTLDDLSKIADQIPLDTRSKSREVRMHLWHFPGFFAAVVGLLSIEWFLRRKKGYA